MVGRSSMWSVGRVRVVVLGSVGGVAGLVVSRFVRDIMWMILMYIPV